MNETMIIVGRKNRLMEEEWCLDQDIDCMSFIGTSYSLSLFLSWTNTSAVAVVVVNSVRAPIWNTLYRWKAINTIEERQRNNDNKNRGIIITIYMIERSIDVRRRDISRLAGHTRENTSAAKSDLEESPMDHFNSEMNRHSLSSIFT